MEEGRVEVEAEVKALPSSDGWQPDPYGMREDPSFTRGEPTRRVRDAGVKSYDEPPASPSPLPSEADIPTFTSPSSVAATPSPPSGEGWQIDPSGHHEYRYFHRGQPTAYVTDSSPEQTDALSVHKGNLAFSPGHTTSAKAPELSAEPGYRPSNSGTPTDAVAMGRVQRMRRIRNVLQRLRPHRSEAPIPVEGLQIQPGEEGQERVDPWMRLVNGSTTESDADRGREGQSVPWLADSYGFSPNGAGSSEN